MPSIFKFVEPYVGKENRLMRRSSLLVLIYHNVSSLSFLRPAVTKTKRSISDRNWAHYKSPSMSMNDGGICLCARYWYVVYPQIRGTTEIPPSIPFLGNDIDFIGLRPRSTTCGRRSRFKLVEIIWLFVALSAEDWGTHLVVLPSRDRTNEQNLFSHFARPWETQRQSITALIYYVSTHLPLKRL